MNDRMRVGFIGIGNMGWPMAANLVRAGFDVAVHDADPTRMQAFCREFQARAPGLAGLATCEVVVTMLPDGHVVRRVLLEGDGGAFINTVQPGKVVVDMSSSEPTGTRLFEVGGSGCGHAAKALNNYLGATAFAAASEAVTIARRFGLAPETLVDILNVSTGKSFISEVVLKEHVLGEKYATGFKLGLLAKDVHIAESLGRAVGLDAPLLRLVDQRWALARERLGFDADNSEAIKGWQDDLPPR